MPKDRYYTTKVESGIIMRLIDQSLIEYNKEKPFPTNFYNQKGKVVYKGKLNDASLAKQVQEITKNDKISEVHVRTVRSKMFGALDQAELQKKAWAKSKKRTHIKDVSRGMWARIHTLEARLAQVEEYLTRTSADQLGGGFTTQGVNDDMDNDFTTVSVAN